MSTKARSPDVDELSCVPETQQAAGVEELVVGVEDPLEMSEQHNSDISGEDTQAARGTQKGKADKRSKKPAVLFSAEQEQKLVDFLRNNEILYNKHLMDYKDRSKGEAVWDKFCEENNLNKDACQRWYQSQRTLFGKVTHMKSSQGGTTADREAECTRDNFVFLRDHIVSHLTARSEFRAPKGSGSQGIQISSYHYLPWTHLQCYVNEILLSIS